MHNLHFEIWILKIHWTTTTKRERLNNLFSDLTHTGPPPRRPEVPQLWLASDLKYHTYNVQLTLGQLFQLPSLCQAAQAWTCILHVTGCMRLVRDHLAIPVRPLELLKSHALWLLSFWNLSYVAKQIRTFGYSWQADLGRWKGHGPKAIQLILRHLIGNGWDVN